MSEKVTEEFVLRVAQDGYALARGRTITPLYIPHWLDLDPQMERAFIGVARHALTAALDGERK